MAASKKKMSGNPFIFPWPKILNSWKRLKMVHTFLKKTNCPFFFSFRCRAPHGAPSFAAPQLTLPPPPLRLEPEKQIKKKSGLRCPIVQVIWFRPLKKTAGAPCGAPKAEKNGQFFFEKMYVPF